jgi:integrase
VADAHFHDIRASAGTEVERRHGQEAARLFLGHKDIRTTMVYLRDRRPNVVRPLARKAST